MVLATGVLPVLILSGYSVTYTGGKMELLAEKDINKTLEVAVQALEGEIHSEYGYVNLHKDSKLHGDTRVLGIFRDEYGLNVAVYGADKEYTGLTMYCGQEYYISAALKQDNKGKPTGIYLVGQSREVIMGHLLEDQRKMGIRLLTQSFLMAIISIAIGVIFARDIVVELKIFCVI